MNALTLHEEARATVGGSEETPLPFPPPEIIRLPRRTVRSLDLTENHQLRIKVSGGAAWVTLEGKPDDFLLTVFSAAAVFSGPGRLVIEAVDGDLTASLAG